MDRISSHDMLKFILKVSGVILLSMSLSACLTEPLEVKNMPVVKPEMVVSTQMISDQSLVVLLTKTFGALEASDDSDLQTVLQQIAVTDASVEIRHRDTVYNLLPLGYGFYGGTSIPLAAGQTYSLQVSSNSLGTVVAKTIVQNQVTFDDVAATLHFNGFGDTLAQIAYTIKDPAERNYYMLNVQPIERDKIMSNLFNPNAFTRIMNDDDFNNEQYGEVFRVFPRDFQPGDTILVSLSNVSEEYYNFVQLRLDNRFSFIQYLSEPVNYPSNVIGGKGFFNLYIPDIRFLILE